MLGLAAGHDAREVLQVRFDVQADPVKADPLAQLDADRGDLVLARPAGALALDPDADPAVTHFAGHVEGGQGLDDPGLQRRHERAHVAAALGQVQHHIDHPLAGAVIGELAAAAALEHREAVGGDQVGGLGRHAGGVERRMLQQPDQLARRTVGDGGRTGLHGGNGCRVGHIPGRNRPPRRRAVRRSQQRKSLIFKV